MSRTVVIGQPFGALHVRRPCHAVIDIYRREGEILAENWTFIDLLYWLMQLGDDVVSWMAWNAGAAYSAPA